jgi:hypothetical protein
MLRRVLQFKDLRLEDVMVPRVDIVAIEENQFMVDLMALFRKAGYSAFRSIATRSTSRSAWSTQRICFPGGPPKRIPWPRRSASAELILVTTIAQSGILREVIFAPASMSAPLPWPPRLANRECTNINHLRTGLFFVHSHITALEGTPSA